jgi:hypothetical protein
MAMRREAIFINVVEEFRGLALEALGSERGTRYHKPKQFNKNDKLPTRLAACVLCL